MLADDRFRPGLEMRRSVLGDDYVDAALARATSFSQPLQEFVTEHVWGSVWTRPGLDDATRSLVTLGMLCASRQWSEISVHVRGAVRNGCTPEQIREVLLHAGAYCGAPVAVQAFSLAAATLTEMGVLDPDEGPGQTSS